MQAFEYANPATLQDALGMLGSKWGESNVLAGGTDLISLMKEYIETPKRLINIKGIKSWVESRAVRRGCASAQP